MFVHFFISQVASSSVERRQVIQMTKKGWSISCIINQLTLSQKSQSVEPSSCMFSWKKAKSDSTTAPPVQSLRLSLSIFIIQILRLRCPSNDNNTNKYAHLVLWSCPVRSRCQTKQDMPQVTNSGLTIILDRIRTYSWHGPVRHLWSPRHMYLFYEQCYIC